MRKLGLLDSVLEGGLLAVGRTSREQKARSVCLSVHEWTLPFSAISEDDRPLTIFDALLELSVIELTVVIDSLALSLQEIIDEVALQSRFGGNIIESGDRSVLESSLERTIEVDFLGLDVSDGDSSFWLAGDVVLIVGSSASGINLITLARERAVDVETLLESSGVIDSSDVICRRAILEETFNDTSVGSNKFTVTVRDVVEDLAFIGVTSRSVSQHIDRRGRVEVFCSDLGEVDRLQRQHQLESAAHQRQLGVWPVSDFPASGSVNTLRGGVLWSRGARGRCRLDGLDWIICVSCRWWSCLGWELVACMFMLKFGVCRSLGGS